MGHFRLFSKYGQKLPFFTHFDPQKELRKKCLIVTDFFPTNKQYLKIKLMQNETNLWSSFFGKDEILVKLCFKGLNYHNFYIFDHN